MVDLSDTANKHVVSLHPQYYLFKSSFDVNAYPLFLTLFNTVRQYIHGKLTTSWKAFGIPLVARLCESVDGSDIYNLYLKLLRPFQIHAEGAIEDYDISKGTATEEVSGKVGAKSPAIGGDVSPSNVNGVDSPSDVELQFYLTDEKGIVKHSKLLMNEPVAVTGVSRLHVLVCWPETQIEHCDLGLLSSLPEVFKSGFYAKRPQESVSLYKCLEAFLQEEPLGPDDMWSVFASLIFNLSFKILLMLYIA